MEKKTKSNSTNIATVAKMILLLLLILSSFMLGRFTVLPGKSESVFMLYKSGRVSFDSDTLRFEANHWPALTVEELKALTTLSTTVAKVVVVPREEVYGKY